MKLLYNGELNLFIFRIAQMNGLFSLPLKDGKVPFYSFSGGKGFKESVLYRAGF